jgi:hypothetical protein
MPEQPVGGGEDDGASRGFGHDGLAFSVNEFAMGSPFGAEKSARAASSTATGRPERAW